MAEISIGSLIAPFRLFLSLLNGRKDRVEIQYSFTVPEYAERHSVSPATVFRWLNSGKLDSIKVGRVRRITVDDEKAFLVKHHEGDKRGEK